MLQTIAVLSILILPVLAWGNTTRLLRRARWKWWARHLVGMLIWHAAIFGVLLLAGSAGTFDGEPAPALGLIGGAIVLGILYWFQHLGKYVVGPSTIAKPAKQSQHTPPLRPKPLTREQRKALNLKEHTSGRTTISVTKAAKQPARRPSTPEPTRAIRSGWSMGEIAFTYEDSAGDITSRAVVVHSVTSTYIKGECHDRKAERTFRLDRIMSDITDIETGEIMDVDKWAERHT